MTITTMAKVENITSSRGNKVANQFIFTDEIGNKYFQSYSSVIVTKYKIYNDEGILVAENIKQILELLELNDYKVVTNDKKKKKVRNKCQNV